MTRLAVLAASVAVLLALPAAAVADNDDFANATMLFLKTPVSQSTVGFTTESAIQEPTSCGSINYRATAWFQVQMPTTGKVTVTTAGSDFDTVVSAYGPKTIQNKIPPRAGCNDDRPGSIGHQTSELTFTGQPNDIYFIQVGGCTGSAACSSTYQGGLNIAAYGAPPNDPMAAPQPVGLEQVVGSDNSGATDDGPLTCNGRAFGRTLWFRFTAPAIGDAVVTASSTGMDPVVSVLTLAGAVLGCGTGAEGAGTVSEVRLRLAPGDYLVQVGGLGSQSESTFGPFNFQVHFTVDTDLDDDGVSPPFDCDDGNPAIRPGAPEMPNNDVDENCDRVKEFDADGDGSRVPLFPADCDDHDARRSPLKREVRGNRIDENCDGKAEPFPLLISRVSAAWDLGPTTVLRQLLLFKARRGSTVTLRCRGRGCHFSRKRIKIRRNAREMTIERRLTPFQRRFAPGTRLTIRLAKRRFSPRETVYRFRDSRIPVRSDFCITDRRRAC